MQRFNAFIKKLGIYHIAFADFVFKLNETKRHWHVQFYYCTFGSGVISAVSMLPAGKGYGSD